MNDYIIRNYSKKDYSELNELCEETGLGGSQRGDNDRIIEQSIQLGGKLILIENPTTRKIIGSSWITFDGRRLHLHHIGVKPSLQNQGLGKLLTKESLNCK